MDAMLQKVYSAEATSATADALSVPIAVSAGAMAAKSTSVSAH